MLKFKTFYEKRRNEHLFPKLNVLEELLEYENLDDIFARFSNSENVLKINPQASMKNSPEFKGGGDFYTPLGLYSYPVSRSIELLTNGESEWPMARNYIAIFKADMSDVVVLSNVGKPQIKDVLGKLQMKFGLNDEDRSYVTNIIINYVVNNFGKNNKAILGAILYNLIHMFESVSTEVVENKQTEDTLQPSLSGIASKRDYDLKNSIELKSIPKFDTHKWRELCLEVGIKGFVDDGFGIIHPAEKQQAVFFQTNILKQIDSLKIRLPSNNKDYRANTNISKFEKMDTIPFSNGTIMELENVCNTLNRELMKYPSQHKKVSSITTSTSGGAFNIKIDYNGHGLKYEDRIRSAVNNLHETTEKGVPIFIEISSDTITMKKLSGLKERKILTPTILFEFFNSIVETFADPSKVSDINKAIDEHLDKLLNYKL